MVRCANSTVGNRRYDVIMFSALYDATFAVPNAAENVYDRHSDLRPGQKFRCLVKVSSLYLPSNFAAAERLGLPEAPHG